MGMAAKLVMCDLDHLYKLSFPLPKNAPHDVWLQVIGQAVSEEKIFEIVDDDGQRHFLLSLAYLSRLFQLI